MNEKYTVLNISIFLTLLLQVLQTRALHQNGVEFHQEFNGHGPRHVTHVSHVSDARFLFGMVQCSMFMTIL